MDLRVDNVAAIYLRQRPLQHIFVGDGQEGGLQKKLREEQSDYDQELDEEDFAGVSTLLGEGPRGAGHTLISRLAPAQGRSIRL